MTIISLTIDCHSSILGIASWMV